MTRKGLTLAAYRLAILLLCIASARANTDVQFNFQNILQVANNSVTNRSFRVDPAPKEFQASGTFLIAPERITTNTFTGTIYLSNMVPMVYDCTLSLGVNGDRTFRITVPDSASLQIASQLITPTAVTTNSLGLLAARAQFVLKNDGWSSNQIGTNFTFSGSTNAFKHTNGAVAGYFLKTDGTNAFWAQSTGGSGSGSPTNLIYGNSDPPGNSVPNDPNNIFFVNVVTGSLFAFGPPWAEVPYAKATVTNGLATISYVNTATNGFAKLISPDSTQFSFTQESNLTAKSGILLTNVSANNITNRGTENITGTLAVGGVATFTNGITAKSTLDVASAVTAASSVNADNVTVTNAFVGKSTANITGALSVGGTTTLTNQLNAQSGANITGAVSVGGVLTATNTVNAQGVVNITGASTLGGTVTATNQVNLQSGENVTGALNIGGTLTASNAVNITGTSTHGGTATFTNGIVGQSTEQLTGALNVGGTGTFSNAVNITGASTHGGTATFTNQVNAQSGANVTGAANVGGTLTASNTVNAQGAVNITGTSTHGGTATFTNQANFQSGVNITGALNVGGGYNFTNFPGATATNLPTGQMLFVDSVNGNDSTAQRGNAARPWLTISNAVAAMQDNDSLRIRGGAYWCNTFGQPSTAAISNGACLNLIGKTNVSIIGEGQPMLIFSNNVAGLMMWNVNGFLVKGLTFFWTNKPAATTITNLVAVIDIGGTSGNGKFEDCKFYNYPDHGIGVGAHEVVPSYGQQTNIEVTSCYFQGGGQTNIVPGPGAPDGSAVVPGPFWNIHDNLFDRQCLRGVEIYHPTGGSNYEGIIVRGNTFRGLYGSALLLINSASGTVTDTIRDIRLEDNLIFDRTPGGPTSDAIAFYGGAGGFSRVMVKNNSFIVYAADYANAINWQTSAGGGEIRDCEFTDNLFYGFANGATMVLADQTGSINVTNCLISRNRFKNAPTSIGLYLAGQGNTIQQNDFVLMGSSFGNIYLANFSGKTRNNKLRFNTFDASFGAGIYLEPGATNNEIADNHSGTFGNQPIRDDNVAGYNTIKNNYYGSGIPFNGTNYLAPTTDVYSRLNQWAPNTVTNITTATNSMIGASIDGDPTLEPGFWTRNKMIVLNQNGSFWTGATPGNTRIFFNLDTSAAKSNTVTQVLFAPPANQANAGYSLEVRGVCMTNSATGAWMFDGTLLVAGSNPLFFTNTVTIKDVTLQSFPGLFMTNGASTSAFKSGTTSMRVQ